MKTLIKTVLSATILLLSFSAHAEDTRCDVESLSDARACLNTLAQEIPGYENEPNQAFTTSDVKSLVKVLKILGARPAQIKQAEQADYVGLIADHGEDHHIFYFTLKNGSNTRAIEVYDLNIVDLPEILTAPYSREAKDVKTYLLGIKKASGMDFVEDLQATLNGL